jgi:glycine/D-amino acid oxidase-like deaminating enzyme
MRDVLIIGAGVTGLAAALHLERRGYAPVVATAAQPGATAAAAGVAAGGQVDNFTRVSHAHGLAFAADLWRFGDAAFARLLEFCAASGVPHARGPRYRLVTSEAELTEATLAVRQLQGAGFQASLLTARRAPVWQGLTDRVLAVQDEGESGAYVDCRALLAALNAAVKAPRLGAVSSLNTARKGPAFGPRVRLANGTEVDAEVVVLACHLAISELVPTLKSALVSVADQWDPFSCGGGAVDEAAIWSRAGTVFSANHTYEWGVVTGSGRLHAGGGRYLRPLAGIEAVVATHDEKIREHLRGQLGKTFRWAATAKTAGAGAAALDCRPCDELPIIGPMFGDDRMLVATGFMGSGLTQGFLAGACLAELIDTGRSAILPRRLWPERLRSLPT